jgi:hypothetical protein
MRPGRLNVKMLVIITHVPGLAQQPLGAGP